MARRYLNYQNQVIPVIGGAKGGKGGGGGGATEDPNSLFSTDIVFITSGLGEGPVYRINPNGPQDIEIQDNQIDDLIDFSTNSADGDKFVTLSATGTTTQSPLTVFGETIQTPQSFASPVSLKKGNLDGVPAVKVSNQETSANDWDAIKFNFQINQLQKVEKNGDVKIHSVTVKITLKNRILTGNEANDTITSVSRTISGKTTSPFRFNVKIVVPEASKSTSGYRFTVEKTSDDDTSAGVSENIQLTSWSEIENSKQAYPRTAVIGYALKAVDEHQGGVPNFTSLVKGLLVRVPSNYNQPVLANGEIDWREVEVTDAKRTGNGYRLQNSATVQTQAQPQIYVGTWDGTFVYSWTQNPVWIIYDILTNDTYGLGIPEDNIDKYKFFQVAQYCDACDSVTGKFVGVDGQADGTFRHKPRLDFSGVRNTLIGLPVGTKIKERRFTLNISIADEGAAMDTLNVICSTFRGALVYSLGKITLAVDMPDEYPVMAFNETNIKSGSLTISGSKESDIISGVDVSYVDPSNHYKREVVRVDSADANDGIERNVIRNIQSLDLPGVTRRSQALRFAQYQIAASKYLRRNVTFTTSTDALTLAPGDVISVAQQMSGIAYGFSGKISANSDSTGSGSNANVFLEHFTSPSLSSTNFTSNSGPLALRVIKMKDDRVDLYLVSNTRFALSNVDVSNGFDRAEINVIAKFNKQSRQFQNITNFSPATIAPAKGDLWTFGEIENPNNFYTNKAGKLFKVTSIDREPDEESVTLSGIEYISNVYVDSDTFIDYTPTAYTDIVSPLSQPPSPVFSFDAVPRERIDGSVVVDGQLTVRNELIGYNQDLRTEFFVSKPDVATRVMNTFTSSGVLNIVANDVLNSSIPAKLTGKNGFSGLAGEIRLLCNAISEVDTAGGTIDGNVQLTLEGLNVAFDENFFKHILEVNDNPAVFSNLKGTDFITVPVREKSAVQGTEDFPGFAGDIVELAVEIKDFDKTTNTIKFENTRTGSLKFSEKLPDAPFFIKINQLLDSRFYSNNSFYVGGSEIIVSNTGSLTSGAVNDIPLHVEPRKSEFVKLFVDGIEKSPSQFTVNLNSGNAREANINYTPSLGESNYRTKIDHYTVPAIELGDNVELAFNNSYSVINTSFDPASAKFNAALTANSIYRVELADSPTINAVGLSFVNISPDISGNLGNISGNTATVDFSDPGTPTKFNLGNNRVYNVEVGGEFEKLFLAENLVIRDLDVGTTSVRARNRNMLGRLSPTTTKSITVSNIPIRKVTNLVITESLYREQTGGVAIRATCAFTHIEGQQVTDYEISYRLDNIDNVGSDDGGADLTAFNTVKVPATGVDSDGKIRFTVSGINRGTSSDTNSIFFRVTPLNKSIRGDTASLSKSIIGKTAKPANIFNFTGGQNTDQITLLWQYQRQDSGDLLDLDLKEVVIRRSPGTISATIENFVASDPLVTVSAGTARKSIPIDTFGTFTYLARTRDTSGNLSDDVVAITLTTTRPDRSTVVAAFNEDSPGVNFTDITNTNAGESNFPSFADSTQGGTVVADGNQTDNSNGTASGFSAIGGSPTDLLAVDDATYITKIRDFGSTVTGSVFVELQATQEIKTTYNDLFTEVLSGVTDATSPNSNVLKETGFGGIGTVLGFSNTTLSPNPRFDANNQTLMTGGASGNVFAILNAGKFTGNVSAISAITKASTARVTTSGSEHGIASTSSPGKRVIVHDVGGMTQINNRELFAKRINATTIDLFTDSGLTSGLDSSGFGTFTSGGVLDEGDFSNANALALIAGTINADHIELGATFFANGEPTGSNAFANVTVGSNAFKLINMTQYSDTGSAETFAGTLGAVTSQVQIRTTTAANSALYASTGTNGRAEGAVQTNQFDGASVNEGFQAYQAGSRTFRQFQLKIILNNSKPNEFDFTIDKFRYSIEKDTVTFTDTVTYDGAPKTVSMTSAGFLNRPVISYAVLTQEDAVANPAIVVTTSASNQQVQFRMVAADGTGEYNANSTATVMVTAIGV